MFTQESFFTLKVREENIIEINTEDNSQHMLVNMAENL